MNSTGSEILELEAGAALELQVPPAAAREPEDALPTVDLSNLPGARVLARRGYADGAATLRVVCAAAPAAGWAPGVEEIVLGRASQLAREALGRDAHGGDVPRFVVGERTEVAPGFEQRFEGVVRRSDAILAVRGRHWLGFAGAPRDALLCTAACTEPQPGRICDALISGTVPVGRWLDAPPPNALARGLMFAAASPWEALAIVAVVSIAIAARIVARRPRPRP